MDIDLVVKITSRAWSLKILALMQAGVPGRQAPLLSASGASRTAFSQSLKHLVDLGLLERNPGHGHPLRPEYRLTALGAQIAQVARRIERLAPQPDETALLRRSWTVPILAVSQAPRHFSEIKTALPPITDRALSQSLQHLQAQHWLQRRVNTSSHPPRPLYQAANAGAQIGAALGLVV
ncbi:MAG: winged helix-turn-helix transcriptional regulator [Ruegeria sp.]|uniref:winged helix-turn-helix transcriptional regulator n=1 Tax=Ruegeria sp. TaxID=1879320 RepID=UPI00349EE158